MSERGGLGPYPPSVAALTRRAGSRHFAGSKATTTRKETMRDAEKNRDPERAQKRARADARCALRKLDLLDRLEQWGEHPLASGEGLALLVAIAEAVGVEVRA